MPVIMRWLKLTEKEYAHLQFVEGHRPSLHVPLDSDVLLDMRHLAALFDAPGPMPAPVEDEARDAAEIVGGM
jgi:hypothetical protein